MSKRLAFVCLLAGSLLIVERTTRADAPRRDLYGDPLPPGVLVRLGTQRLRHLDRVFDVTFSPDGKVLASTGADQRIRLWDAASGQPLRTLAGHTEPIRSVTFSPDGKILVSTGSDQTIRFWNPLTGQEIAKPIRRSSNFAVFAPDGKTLAYSPDSGIGLWDVGAGKLHDIVTSKPANAVAFAPDGKMLAAAIHEREQPPTITLWDTVSGKPFWSAKGHRQAAWSVAFSPDGKTLVSGGGYDSGQGRSHGEIIFWESATGKKLREIPGLRKIVSHVCFSPDGKYLASAGWDGPIILWDWKAVDGPRRVWEDAGSASAIAFAPDSRRLAWCTRHGIHILDLPPRENKAALGGHWGPVPFVAFTPDGKTVVSAAETIRVWDAATGKPLRVSSTSLKELAPAALTPDGKRLLTGGQQATTLWDLASLKPLRSFATPDDHALALALSPDGKTLAAILEREVYSTDKRGQISVTRPRSEALRLWDVDSAEEKPSIGKGTHPEVLAYSPDGNRIASSHFYTDGIIRLWNVKDGTLSAGLKPQPAARGNYYVACFSPDGNQLVSSDWSGVICWWDAHSGKLLRSLQGHDARIRTLVFSPDGQTMLSAGNDETLRLWDAKTGKSLHVLTGHQAPVLAAVFSPDGQRIASASADTTILMWDVPNLARLLRPPPPPGEEEWHELWVDLGSASGYSLRARAIRRMTACPRETVAFLRRSLIPPPPRDEQVVSLLADLDSDAFQTREEASRKLAGMGKKVVPFLRRALSEKPSLEKRLRLQSLLEPHRPQPDNGTRWLTAEEQRLEQFVYLLDRIGSDEALDLLQYLVDTGELAVLLENRSLPGEAQYVRVILQRAVKRRAKP